MRIRKQIAAAALVAALAVPMAASARDLDLTFEGPTAYVGLNGATFETDPLTLTIRVDTADLSIGTGFAGSNEYTPLSAFVSSAPLGLTNVAVTTPFTVEIGTPGLGAPYAGTTVLLESGATLNGFYGESAIGSWDDISPIGPFNFFNLANGDLSLSLVNGDTLSIGNFDNGPTYREATFQATAPAPEPAVWALMIVGLGLTGFALRRTRPLATA